MKQFTVTKRQVIDFVYNVEGDNAQDAQRIAEDLGEVHANETLSVSERWTTKQVGQSSEPVVKKAYHLACGHVRSIVVGSNEEKAAISSGTAKCLVFNPAKGPEFGTFVKIVEAPAKAAPAPKAAATPKAPKASKAAKAAETEAATAAAAEPEPEPVAEAPAAPKGKRTTKTGKTIAAVEQEPTTATTAADARMANIAKLTKSGKTFICPICGDTVVNFPARIAKHVSTPKHQGALG